MMTTMHHRPRRCRSLAAILVTAALLSPAAALAVSPTAASPASTPPAATTHGASDPDALALADRLMEALGGEAAWQAVRFVRFTFAGRRTHHWDRQTGRHRMEVDDEEGRHVVVLGNVISRTGRAWRDGEEITGEAAREAVEGAYAAWINDTYWLFMPYKLRDPGVTLTYEGEKTLDGTAYDVVHLSFDNVGLTPGDHYWAFINRETGLMERWEYRLESYPPGKEPTPWLWQEWDRYGGILLASLRSNPETGRELPLDDIAVVETMPEAVFTSPEPVPPAP